LNETGNGIHFSLSLSCPKFSPLDPKRSRGKRESVARRRTDRAIALRQTY
jgi:hypothetical protein